MAATAQSVLLIEDDPLVRDYLKEVIRETGHTVLTAPDGHEGLAQYFDSAPDIVVLDLRLPRMDGIEVLRRIRLCSNVPVIVLSAISDGAEKTQVLLRGANEVLSKPVGADALLTSIVTLLKSRVADTA
jgi:two-component system KDP operon response regulator KdpE